MTACRAQNVHDLLKNRSKSAEVFLWKKQGDFTKSPSDFLSGLTGASGAAFGVTHLKKTGQKFLLFKPQKSAFSAREKLHKKHRLTGNGQTAQEKQKRL